MRLLRVSSCSAVSDRGTLDGVPTPNRRPGSDRGWDFAVVQEVAFHQSCPFTRLSSSGRENKDVAYIKDVSCRLSDLVPHAGLIKVWRLHTKVGIAQSQKKSTVFVREHES